MTPPILVTRIPLVDDLPLDLRISNECELRANAGYVLASAFTVETELVFIFRSV